jgi:CHAT domain-containing protein/tetratricopeptide (TPR) repeat protein
MFKFLFISAFLFHLFTLSIYGLNRQSDSNLADEYLARAEVLYERSDYDSLPWYYSEALKVYSALNDTNDLIRCYLGFAEYYRIMSDYKNAVDWLEKARLMMTGNIQQYFDLQADMNYINGKVMAGKGEYREALIYIRRASAINGGRDPKKNSRYLNYIGNIYDMNEDFDSAEYYFRESYREINLMADGPAVEKAWFYINISKIYNRRGEYDSALNYLVKSINTYTELYGEGFPDLMNSYLNLAYYYLMIGYPDTARFYLDKTEVLVQKDSMSASEFIPALYEFRGLLKYSNGDYLQALKAYNQALETAIQVYGQGHPFLYQYYNNCANAYRVLNDFEEALHYYNKAAEIVKNMHPSGIISSYYYLATTYASAGYAKEADYFYNKLITGRAEFLGPGHPLLSYDYLSYGDFLTSEGRCEEAKKYLESALLIRKKNLGEKHYLTAEAYRFLGQCYLKMKDWGKALDNFQKGLISVAPGFGDMDWRSNPVISENINLLAFLKLLKDKALTLEEMSMNKSSGVTDNGYLDASYHTYQSAVDVILKLQNEWLTEESRLYLSENENETFLALIRISLDLHELTGKEEYLSAGFETAEKMKYSTLLAVLRDQKALEEGKVPEELKNLDNQIRQELAAYNYLLSSEYETEAPDSLKIRNWNKKIFDLSNRRDELLKQLSKKYPEYYSLKYFPGIINAELVRKKLGSNDILCEYVLTDTTLITFIVDREGLAYRRTGIDSSFYRDIRAVYDFVRKGYFNTSSEQAASYLHASSELYNYLIGNYHFKDNRRLIIIPDGMLAYIPFDILLTKPVEGNDYNFGRLDYIIDKYTLSYGYSATLLFQPGLRRLRAGKSLLAFAPSDPETMVVEKYRVGDNPMDSTNLKPLAGSAKEIRSIVNIAGGDLRLGNEASEHNFKELSSQYRILHLAAHAIINEDDPLHSTLVFSSDKAGMEDGMLNVSEIYNLDLNASMVVLSACNTGTGTLKRGEGIMSLARAFFYAGVPSVVMTLWPVGDESCSRLMTYFYKNLAAGESKDEALRNAKLTFIRESDPILQHPFYWAGYIVVGERSAVFLPWIKIYLIAGAILIISVTAFLFRKRIFRKGMAGGNSPD